MYVGVYHLVVVRVTISCISILHVCMSTTTATTTTTLLVCIIFNVRGNLVGLWVGL